MEKYSGLGLKIKRRKGVMEKEGIPETAITERG